MASAEKHASKWIKYSKLLLGVNVFVIVLVSGPGCIPALWPRPKYETKEVCFFRVLRRPMESHIFSHVLLSNHCCFKH